MQSYCQANPGGSLYSLVVYSDSQCQTKLTSYNAAGTSSCTTLTGLNANYNAYALFNCNVTNTPPPIRPTTQNGSMSIQVYSDQQCTNQVTKHSIRTHGIIVVINNDECQHN